MFTEADIIHRYTRAQALADGVLVAVPETLQKEAGFRIPVAMTSAVYEDCVAWSVADSERQQVAQDQDARLWDLLAMARFAAHCEPERSLVAFDLTRYPRRGGNGNPRRTRLVMTIHQGDAAEPVITIMQPGES